VSHSTCGSPFPPKILAYTPFRGYLYTCSGGSSFKLSDEGIEMPTTYDGVLHDEGGAVFNVKNPTYWTPLAGEDSTDDAMKIKRAIAAANTANGGTVYLPQGTYICKSVIDNLTSKVTLAGCGAGTILQRGPAFGGPAAGGGSTTAYLILVDGGWTGCSDIVIRDLKLDGYNRGTHTTLSDDYSGSSLLFVKMANHCTIENVWAYDGLYNGIILEYCKDTVVANCKAETFLKTGIYLSGCNRVMLTGNCSEDSNLSGTYIATSWYCTAVGNDFRAGALGYAGLHLGRDTEYCTITGNYCQGIRTEFEPVVAQPAQPGGVPAYITGERTDKQPPYDWDGTYTSDHIAKNGTQLAHYYSFYNSVISSNVVYKHSFGVRLVRCSGVRVQGNLFANISGTVIHLYGSSGNIISDNTIVDNGASGYASILIEVLEAAQNLPDKASDLPANDNVIEGNDIRDTRTSKVVDGIRINTATYQATPTPPIRTVIRNNRIDTLNPIVAGTGATTVKYGNYFPATGTVDGGITP
jgi:parallel beta-helix repeat protein